MKKWIAKLLLHVNIVLLSSFLSFFFAFSGFSQTISTGNPSSTYLIGSSAITLAPSLTVTSGSTISVASISIQTVVSGDILDATYIPSGFTENWNGSTKTLTISGDGSASDYQSILRSVTFSTTSTTPTNRRIDFTLGSGVCLTIDNKQHYYEVLYSSSSITWQSANTNASSRTFSGETGYLATITSATENQFLKEKVLANTWIGGSDDPTYTNSSEGEWYWVTGPEAGTQFWTGGYSGHAVNGKYENWNDNEPNNADSDYGENFAHMYSSNDGVSGTWNDFVYNNSSVHYYIVEYGGYSYSPSAFGSSDYVDVTVTTNTPPVADNDSYSLFYTNTGTVFSVSQANGVLNGDTDADGDGLSAVLVLGVSHGTLSLNSNGSFTYTPFNSYLGSDSFTYQAYDGKAYSNTATVSLNVVVPHFTGAGANDNFSNNANWNCGYYPPESLNIVIDANQNMVVDQNYTCKNLQFMAGSSFNCVNGSTLTITGDILKSTGATAIDVNSSLQVKSSIQIQNP